MRIAGLGGIEWLVIALVLMLVFGTGKIASFGPALGKSIRGFREELHKGKDETPKETTQAPPATPAKSDTNKES